VRQWRSVGCVLVWEDFGEVVVGGGNAKKIGRDGASKRDPV